MTWFEVDDNLADSPEVMGIPKRYRLAAVGLWTSCGAWLSKNTNSDFFVPDVVVTQYGGTPLLVDCLVAAELLQRGSGGVLYTLRRCRVKTPEQAQRTRSGTAERVQRHRGNKRDHPPPAETERRNGVTTAHSGNGVTTPPVRGVHTITYTDNCGTEERASYVSDPREAEERAASLPPQDDPFTLGTADRATDLSPPVNQGASRLVSTVLPSSFGNSAIRAGLRIEASALICAGETEDDVAECLRVWLQKPNLGVGALKACMAEVHKMRLPTAAALSGADAKVDGWLNLGKDEHA